MILTICIFVSFYCFNSTIKYIQKVRIDNFYHYDFSNEKLHFVERWEEDGVVSS